MKIYPFNTKKYLILAKIHLIILNTIMLCLKISKESLQISHEIKHKINRAVQLNSITCTLIIIFVNILNNCSTRISVDIHEKLSGYIWM